MPKITQKRFKIVFFQTYSKRWRHGNWGFDSGSEQGLGVLGSSQNQFRVSVEGVQRWRRWESVKSYVEIPALNNSCGNGCSSG